jgi:hypothetical protein
MDFNIYFSIILYLSVYQVNLNVDIFKTFSNSSSISFILSINPNREHRGKTGLFRETGLKLKVFPETIS